MQMKDLAVPALEVMSRLYSWTNPEKSTESNAAKRYLRYVAAAAHLTGFA
jgi:hypothetical protein